MNTSGQQQHMEKQTNIYIYNMYTYNIHKWITATHKKANQHTHRNTGRKPTPTETIHIYTTYTGRQMENNNT